MYGKNSVHEKVVWEHTLGVVERIRGMVVLARHKSLHAVIFRWWLCSMSWGLDMSDLWGLEVVWFVKDVWMRRKWCGGAGSM